MGESVFFDGAEGRVEEGGEGGGWGAGVVDLDRAGRCEWVVWGARGWLGLWVRTGARQRGI